MAFAIFLSPHPARFSDAILGVLERELAPYLARGGRVLDPCAGVGLIHRVAPTAVANEIEPEWAAQCDGPTVVSDAERLPFRDEAFEAIATSPTYGNRMADHHEARDGSYRVSYRHFIGRPLHPENTGQMHWGPKYREKHDRIWRECARVLAPGGIFLLNVSDHVHRGEVVPVAEWHVEVMRRVGLRLVDRWAVETRRMRYGANRQREKHEHVFKFQKEAS